MKKYRLFCFLSILVLTASLAERVLPQNSLSAFQQPLITLRADNERLKDVFDRMSELSGYEIGLRPRWHDIRVSVNLKNEPLERALLTILGIEINHAISWKEAEKKIFVFISEIPAKKVEDVAENEEAPGDDQHPPPSLPTLIDSLKIENQAAAKSGVAVPTEDDELQQKKQQKLFFRVGRGGK